MEINLIIGGGLFFGSILYTIFSTNKAMWLLPIFIIGSNGMGFLDDHFLSIRGIYNIKDITLGLLFLLALTRLWAIKKPMNNKLLAFFWALIVFFFVQLFLSFLKYENFTGSISVFRKQIYYLGFPLLCIIFSSVTRNEFYSFLKILIVLTLIQSFLYVLKSTTGINYFGVDDYQVITFGEVEIARNFRAFPKYIYLLIVFVVVNIKRPTVKYMLLLLIFLTIFFSYTRSKVIFALFFAITADFLRKSSFGHRISVFIRFSLLLIIAILIFQHFFGDNFLYLVDRLEKMQKGGIDESSINIRFDMIKAGIDYIFSHDPFFGIGYINRESFSHMINVKNFGSEMGDTAWGNLVVQYGFVGNIILWTFIFVVLRESFLFYFKCPKEKLWITIYIFMAFLILPFHSIMSSILQNPSPVSYLPWALFLVERYDYWVNEKLNDK